MKSEKTNITIFNSQKSICEWESDKKDEQYCRDVWKKTIEAAEIKEDDYIDQIFQKMNDAEKLSKHNKNLWKSLEHAIIILSALFSFLNGLVNSLPDAASLPVNF